MLDNRRRAVPIGISHRGSSIKHQEKNLASKDDLPRQVQ
jgi:hypothetical protein